MAKIFILFKRTRLGVNLGANISFKKEKKKSQKICIQTSKINVFLFNNSNCVFNLILGTKFFDTLIISLIVQEYI